MAPNASPRSCAEQAGTSSTFAEEDSKLINSGLINAFFVGKTSKRTFYAVLSERCLELHTSEKLQRRKKNAKHIIDLSNCFNVSRHFDPKFKNCVAVVSPDETLLMKSDCDSDLTFEWYDSLLQAIISARALYLGRPVTSNEFFESVWDVELTDSPKLKKPMLTADNYVNVGKRMPQFLGNCRLCFYAHSVVICKTGIEPASHGLPKSGIPPLKKSDYVEVQRQSVASFGSQEKYFIMRVGRSSSLGTCEVWARTDSDETAASIHANLTEIIERETEKKRRGLQYFLHNAQMSEISGSEGGSRRSSETAEGSAACRNNIALSDTNSEQGTVTSARQKRSILRELKAFVDSLDENERHNNETIEEDIPLTELNNNRSVGRVLENDPFRRRQKTFDSVNSPAEVEEQKRAHTVGSYAGSRLLNMIRKRIDSGKRCVDARRK